MSITLGSLSGEDLRELGELGLLPETSSEGSTGTSTSRDAEEQLRRTDTLGLPWFQDLIRGSELGRLGWSRRGGGVSADGRTRVEWEIVEFNSEENGGNGSLGTVKRKIGEIVGGEGQDVQMSGGS